MSKILILLDENVSMPQRLADKENPDGYAKLNPFGEVSDLLSDKLLLTYPLKYAVYDEKNKEHARLVKEGKYPEATKNIINELDVEFATLSREDKLKAIAYIKKLKTGKEAVVNS